MAIYHFNGTIISRSQGRSVVACAAYRSGEKLHDERRDKTHDYSHKKDIVFSEVLLPDQAPTWTKDREKLWNAVEQSERRKDAQLAREFNIALPRELNLQQQVTLTKEFMLQEFVSKGMIADVCIHHDKAQDGGLQPHIHIMLTLREVTSTGFGSKVRTWNAKENLLIWREAWASLVNQHLLHYGFDIRIDHRTLKEQGIDLEPQHKIGPSEARERLARLEDHQRIARSNGEKILADPNIALDALTRQHSTFTHHDTARFVNRHTVDSEQFQHVLEAIKNSDQLVCLGPDKLGQERFSTKTIVTIERQMVAHAASLVKQENHIVREGFKEFALALKPLTEEQQTAFNHLVSPGDLKCIVGFAGTGKSYLLGSAREAWECQGYRVLGATLSGIAADSLTASSAIEARTLASRFYYWDKGEQTLSDKDILVIDEAGMIGSRQMAKVLEQVSKRGAKLVLIGDPEQLQAIEAGAAFRTISERTGYVELTDIRRQKEKWQREATCEFALGHTGQALKSYDQHHHLHSFQTQQEAQKKLLSLWNDVRISNPDQSQIILAYTRKEVQELNERARQMRREQGELGKEQLILTDQGELKLAKEDRIYFLKNSRELGVKNGTLGTVKVIYKKYFIIRLDHTDMTQQQPSNRNTFNRTVLIHLDHYNYITHGYAATIHKAQGVTVDRSYILASQYFDRHATYVAATRHRESTDIFYSHEVFTTEKALINTLSRERAKDITVDYTLNEKNPSPKENFLSEIPEKETVEEKDKYLQYEKYFQKIAKGSHELDEKLASWQTPDFSAFKTEFEKSHLEMSQKIETSLRSIHERTAIEAETTIKELERKIELFPSSNQALHELEKYTKTLAKQPEVMNYLSIHNPDLSQKIQNLVKSVELKHDRDLSL